MQEYTRLKEVAQEDDIEFALVVDAELFRLDAAIRWLDAVDGRLKRAPRPIPEPRVSSTPERLRRRIGATQ